MSLIVADRLEHSKPEGILDPHGAFIQHHMRVSEPSDTRIFYGISERQDVAHQDFNVVIAPGMHRSTPYFFKLAGHFAQAGGNTYVIDWAGQGASTAHLDNPHHLDAMPITTHANHFAQFLDESLGDRASLPTYIIGHSWGSLPLVEALTNDQTSPGIHTNVNIQGVCFYAPFFSMHRKFKRHQLHRGVDVISRIPGLRAMRIPLEKNGVIAGFLRKVFGRQACDEVAIRTPEIQELDSDYHQKSFSPRFIFEARKAQQRLLKRLKDVSFDFKTSIAVAELERFTCNDACENWATELNAPIILVDDGRHSGLYDLPNGIEENLLAAFDKAGIPRPPEDKVENTPVLLPVNDDTAPDSALHLIPSAA